MATRVKSRVWWVPGCALLVAASCRAARRDEEHGLEYEGASALGLRSQPADWTNSSVPVIHLDASLRPQSWPAGPKVSVDLTGFFGDDMGEQTVSLGLGLARSFALGPRTWCMLGAGRQFLETDQGDIFDPATDSWQANYLEAGIGWALTNDPVPPHLGLELRYTNGNGPELDGERLGGEFLDLFVVVSWGP